MNSEAGREPEGLARDGFVGVPGVLSPLECSELRPNALGAGAFGGTRCQLSARWCAALAQRLREHDELRAFIPPGHVAVQCTYFEKSSARNWLVSLHQDLSLPVAGRVEGAGLSGWAEKEGALFVHGPVTVLEHMVAVRLHLDGCGPGDGPLRVVPGSHTRGVLSPAAATEARKTLGEQVCVAEVGAALVMRPLLLHASSKSQGPGQRRVLHFLYGPRDLPHGLRWRTAV